MHCAIHPQNSNADPRMLQLLFRAGCPTRQSYDNELPLPIHIAIDRGNLEMVNLFDVLFFVVEI